MEKRNVIEEGRTPHMDEQAELDTVEKAAAELFDPNIEQRCKPVPADRTATVAAVGR